MIPGFCHSVNEVFTLLGCYAAFFLDCVGLEGWTDRLCQNVSSYQATLHNIPEEWSVYHLHNAILMCHAFRISMKKFTIIITVRGLLHCHQFVCCIRLEEKHRLCDGLSNICQNVLQIWVETPDIWLHYIAVKFTVFHVLAYGPTTVNCQ
jgi:hypothetical protein